jgi:AcrR family transcriptional regulator
MATRKKAKPPKTYHLHRERQRRRILDAAQKLFDERGLDRTTMAEVISASGVRASTLYEYFSNKDDIVWAILTDLLEEHALRTKKCIEGASTGLAKITGLLEYMAEELAKDDAKVRFMAQFDAMYARDWPVERLLTLEGRIFGRPFEVFRTYVREGIADGSLRSDLDPDLTLHAVINAVIAAQRRLASLGKKVELEYGQSTQRMFQETIRILVFGLSAPGRSQRTKPSARVKARKSTQRKRSS